MRSALAVAVLLLAVGRFASAQVTPNEAAGKVPVYISHTGDDGAGARFVAAVKRELSKSRNYELGNVNSSAYERRFRLYIGISTLDVSSAPAAKGASVASVVIEQMGLPNSWPVATMWYHKVFLINSGDVDAVAQRFISDMGASYCNSIKSSIGNCPKETIPPIHNGG